MRIGQGFDVHRLAPGRELFLGGVKVEADFGLLGHSDADALLHAVCDALLGALALGDIGDHFPDTDPQYQGASSRALLARVVEMVQERGYEAVNVDATIFAERPKLGPLKRVMAASIAEMLGLAEDAVSVKAKTGEGLGEVGRGEAIAAQAVVLLRPRRGARGGPSSWRKERND